MWKLRTWPPSVLHRALLASSWGASPQQAGAAPEISANLRLRFHLHGHCHCWPGSVHTSRAPKDASFLGQETDISFSLISHQLQLFLITKCWRPGCEDGDCSSVANPPLQRQRVRYRAYQHHLGPDLQCPPCPLDHHPL